MPLNLEEGALEASDMPREVKTVDVEAGEAVPLTEVSTPADSNADENSVAVNMVGIEDRDFDVTSESPDVNKRKLGQIRARDANADPYCPSCPTWWPFRFAHVKQRVKEEGHMCARHSKVLAFSAFVLIYGALMVYRNLAFYFNPYTDDPTYLHRLKDLGFEIFKKISEDNKKYAEIPMYLMQTIGGFLIVSTFIAAPEGRPDKPHLANIFRRIMPFYAAMHTLRFCTYITTALPGSGEHCLDVEKMDPPASLGECFYRSTSTNGNCGDLIFSGHMLTMIMLYWTIWRYGPTSFGITRSHKFWRPLIILMGLLVFAQMCCIAASRNHYTVDVVVALWGVPLALYFWNKEIHPQDDMNIDYEAMEKEEQEESQETSFYTFLRWGRRIILSGILFMVCWVLAKGNFNF